MGSGLAAIFLLIAVATLLVRGTTRYVLLPDRLVIERLGLVWLEILFQDIDAVECSSVFRSAIRQVRMYQLGLRLPLQSSRGLKSRSELVRITRRKGLRYVLINPDDPATIVEAVRSFKADHWRESPWDVGLPLPSFLRPSDNTKRDG